MSLGERYEELYRALKMSQTTFAKAVGTTQSTMAKIVSNSNSPNSKIITATLQEYPLLNPRWLLLGQGKMWEEGTAENLLDNQHTPQKDIIRLAVLEKENEGLKTEVEGLKRELQLLREMVDLLKKNPKS